MAALEDAPALGRMGDEAPAVPAQEETGEPVS